MIKRIVNLMLLSMSALMLFLFPALATDDGWSRNASTWYYYHSNAPATGWLNDSGTWYYLSDSGTMQTGWQYIDGVWYHLTNSGAMATGWANVDGTWYYMNNSGAMQTGWLNDGAWYYLTSSGAMATGWVNDNGTWYYHNNSGAMQIGWIYDGGWYYLNSSGAMSTGWAKIGDSWYYLSNSGLMHTGWLKISGDWFYFHSSGVMATGWQHINGDWYYMLPDGAMACDTTLTIDDKDYCFDSNGAYDVTLTDGTDYIISYTAAKVYIDRVGSTLCQLLGVVENIGNKPMQIQAALADVETASGKLLAAEEYVTWYPEVIYPGEKAYLRAEPKIEGVSANTKISVSYRLTATSTRVNATRCSTRDISIRSSSEKAVKVLGRVTNTTGKKTWLGIEVVLFNKRKQPIGMVDTFVVDVPSGKTVGFEADGFWLPMNITADDIASYQVFAHPI